MNAQSGVTTKHVYNMLMESQYWPPEQMLAYQRTQLEQLLRHSKANVPFYETRLDCVFRKDGSIDWNRWEEIPIVTRADLRDRREEMQARVLPPGHGPTKVFSSSGSTGVPIKVTTTYLAGLARIAAWERYLRVRGFTRPLRTGEFRWRMPDGSLMETDFIYEKAQGAQYPVLTINRRLPIQRRLDLLNEFQIECYIDQPNSILMSAQANLLRAKPVRLMAIQAFAMGVSKTEQEFIENSFQGQLLSAYSSKEGGLMGFQCMNRSRFHVNDELLKMEIVGDNGTTLHAGQDGSIIITPFFSTAQPLIRYRQGDLAASLDSCGCGICLKSISSIRGRTDAVFFAFGQPIPVIGIDEFLMQGNLGSSAHQLAQVGPDSVEVRYVAPMDVTETKQAAIVAHLRALLHRDLNFSFKRVADLPFSPGGKQNRYVQEYDTPFMQRTGT